MPSPAHAVTLAVAVALTAALPGGAAAAPRGTAAPAVSTITFDFESAIKTTFYADGSVYEEGFDPARMRRLATKPAPAGADQAARAPAR